MPNPTLLDTDAMKYAEIGRRADLSKIPIQFAQSMGAGLNAAKTVEDIQNDRAKREKAAEFEKILQGGLPTMKQAWQELGPDGQKKVPDPALFTDSREATASWWQLATETHGRNQVSTHLGAGEYDKAAGVAAGFVKDPTTLINTRAEADTKNKAEKAKQDREAALQTKFSSWRKTVSGIMDSHDYTLDDKALNKITDSFPDELAGYEAAEKFRDNLVRKNAPNPASAAGQGLKESGQLFSQEQQLASDFRQETKNFEPALTSYAKTVNAIKQNNPLDAYVAIINMVKTLDPTSTVREGEKMTAENSAAGGKWDAFRKWANQVYDGRLDENVRKNLAASARQLIDAEQKGYTRSKKKYERIIAGYARDGYKFNTERILGGGEDEINAVLDEVIPGITPEKPKAAPAAAAKPAKMSDEDLIADMLK